MTDNPRSRSPNCMTAPAVVTVLVVMHRRGPSTRMLLLLPITSVVFGLHSVLSGPILRLLFVSSSSIIVFSVFHYFPSLFILPPVRADTPILHCTISTPFSATCPFSTLATSIFLPLRICNSVLIFIGSLVRCNSAGFMLLMSWPCPTLGAMFCNAAIGGCNNASRKFCNIIDQKVRFFKNLLSGPPRAADHDGVGISALGLQLQP